MKKIKKKWVVVVVVIFILAIVVAFLRSRWIPAIKNIRWESITSAQVNIAWTDDAQDKIYTIYWSDKPGINVRYPSTYKRSKVVSGYKTTIEVPYNYVYFRIGKIGHTSSEYEVKVEKDKTFCKDNLNVKLIKRGNPMTIAVDILDEAEQYRIYYKMADESVLKRDYNVKGMKRTNLKLENYEDAMIYISSIKDGLESDLKFLMYNEKIFLNPLKWLTTTQLC